LRERKGNSAKGNETGKKQVAKKTPKKGEKGFRCEWPSLVDLGSELSL